MLEENQKTGPRDVFLNIFSIIALYVSMVSLSAVVFQLINFYFPDYLLSDYNLTVKRIIRWPLAVLTVMFPLYIYSNIILQRELIKYPQKKELKTRKWLLYLTIFIAVLVIAGNFITLVFRYLEGELSVRFFLKVGAVFLIASSVFAYYGWNVRKEILSAQNKRMSIFVKSVVFLVLLVIIFGYFIAGSPQLERQRRFDEIRISNLQQIQWQIIDFWRVKGKLPNSSEELKNELSGFIPPKDPQTGEQYEYRLIGNLSFELCANFNTSNKEQKIIAPQSVYQYGVGGEELWWHERGRHCFQRIIDPEFFPPYKKEKF